VVDIEMAGPSLMANKTQVFIYFLKTLNLLLNEEKHPRPFNINQQKSLQNQQRQEKLNKILQFAYSLQMQLIIEEN
jgi:hypothetical protein